MKKKQIFFTTIVFLLLTACSGENGTSTSNGSGSESSSTPTDNAPAVDNEDLSPGLKGIDADGNGIRDDIDRFIARHYSITSTIKKVAEKKARAFQKSMEANTHEEAQAAGNMIFMAGDCAFQLLPHATEQDMKFIENMSIEIKALTANTKERFSAYWNGESLAGGMVFKVTDDPVCE